MSEFITTIDESIEYVSDKVGLVDAEYLSNETDDVFSYFVVCVSV